MQAAQSLGLEDLWLAGLLGVGGAPHLGVALARLVFTSSPRLFARYFLSGLDLVKGVSVSGHNFV